MSNTNNIFTKIESNVRSYCRSFPTNFTTSKDYEIFDASGKVYIDFFSGAGGLNYGHNNSHLKQALLNYVESDGISHSLDMHTEAKRQFLNNFNEIILQPRNLNYKVMFPGPTGTNAVEAALKLARKVTGRRDIVHFEKSFHGMTLGALSVTANPKYRRASGIPLTHTFSIPFICESEYSEQREDLCMSQLSTLIKEHKPAAIILETVQAEGGINVANVSWLKRIFEYAEEHGILVIVDDIQVGCGRTGTFFSFERAGLKPDLICLSKSISGYGTPMSLLLIRPELDVWEPGEHNGTFRGNNLAFVTASTALSHYWQTNEFEIAIKAKGQSLAQRSEQIVARYPKLQGSRRGIGAIQGIACASGTIAKQISHAAFERGLIVETAGSQGEVLKLLPPLTITPQALDRGMNILEETIDAVLLREFPKKDLPANPSLESFINKETASI